MPKKLPASITRLPFLRPILILIFINLTIIALVLILHNSLPPQVPLYFGRPLGPEQLANKYSLIIPPLFSLAVIFGNISLIQLIKDQFLRYTLLGMMFILTLLSSVTVIKIILIIGSL